MQCVFDFYSFSKDISCLLFSLIKLPTIKNTEMCEWFEGFTAVFWAGVSKHFKTPLSLLFCFFTFLPMIHWTLKSSTRQTVEICHIWSDSGFGCYTSLSCVYVISSFCLYLCMSVFLSSLWISWISYLLCMIKAYVFKIKKCYKYCIVFGRQLFVCVVHVSGDGSWLYWCEVPLWMSFLHYKFNL